MARKRRGRGEGGVRQRESDGLWEGTLSLGYHPDGRRNRVSVYADTKAEVLREMDRLRSEARSGAATDAGRLTVSQLLERWLASRQGEDSPTTLESRAHHIRSHLAPRLGALSLAKLHRLHAEGLVADMRRDGVKPFAIEAAIATLITALEYAVWLQLIPSNPAAGVKPRRPRKEMHALDAAGAKALLTAAAGLPICDLLTLALASGCRQGELLALEWSDLDLTAGTLTVRRTLVRTRAGTSTKGPKTAAGRRTIALPDFAVQCLLARREARQRVGLLVYPVFSTKSGKYLHRRNVKRALDAVIDRANDPERDRKGGRRSADFVEAPRERKWVIPEGFRWHDIRHSAASILLSAGHSILAVSRRLGHSKPSITLNLYAHTLPGDDARLASEMGRIMGD